MMSAVAAARELSSANITLDDVAEMATVDENHRYEMSADGVLSVMTPPDLAHDRAVSRLFGWFVRNGLVDELVRANSGIAVGSGGRQPDLSVWARLPVRTTTPYADPADALLVIEVCSPSTELIDREIKFREYAAAGVANYWIVGRDQAQMVDFYRLDVDRYARAAPAQPLDWLLNGTVPEL